MTLVLGDETINDFLLLFPDRVVVYRGLKVYLGEDIIHDVLFGEGGEKPFREQARILRHDSLIIHWIGPAREMDKTIHHFYNYTSWESWLVDSYDGIVQFTIYESDLKSK